MKKLLQRYRNTGLNRKLVLLTAAVLLIVLTGCQLMLYACISGHIREQACQEADTVLTQAQTYIDSRLRNVVERLFYIRLDPSFDEALTDFLLGDDPSSEGIAMTMLSHTLSLHKVTEPLISSMFLYTPKKCFTDMGILTEADYRFEASALMRQLESENGSILWGKRGRDEIFISHRDVVPVMYRFTVDGYAGDCVLLANLDTVYLTEYLNEILPCCDLEIIIEDAGRHPVTHIYREETQALPEDPSVFRPADSQGGVFTQDAAGGHYLTARRSLANAPWSLLYLQSTHGILAQLRRMRLVFLAASIGSVLFLMPVLTRIVHSVTQPLMQLSRRMNTVETTGDLQKFDYPYRNEIGVLANSFNRMLERMQQLLQEQESYIRQLQKEKENVRIEQQLKRRAELKALQAQINPHFLYNTLDSIRWKAEMAGAADISQMTTALAALFRTGLSRGREIISLEQEILHVSSYLQIQKFRYGDKLSYSVEIDPGLSSLYTVKLILQPLVENAIYHGIKESEHPGKIRITGTSEGEHLLLSVEDNGPGIRSERLAILQADLARGLSVSGEGYGIFNVNERIRLYFGAEYGLTLDSVYGEGTRACVTLPCITQSEVEQYVSPADS